MFHFLPLTFSQTIDAEYAEDSSLKYNRAGLSLPCREKFPENLIILRAEGPSEVLYLPEPALQCQPGA